MTGRRPFEGSGFAEVVDKIAHRKPDAVARYNYDTPRELERIILKCLEKNPEERYPSARDLLVDLRRLRRELAIPADKDVGRLVEARGEGFLFLSRAFVSGDESTPPESAPVHPTDRCRRFHRSCLPCSASSSPWTPRRRAALPLICCAFLRLSVVMVHNNVP